MNSNNRNSSNNSNAVEISTASPFLNEYKLKFVLRRLLQTFLSGLLLKFDSDNETPWFIYLLQLVLFFMPFFFGGIFILSTDLSSYSRLYLSVIAAIIYFLFILLIKLALLILSNRKHYKNEKKNFQKSMKNNLAPLASRKSRQQGPKASLFNDEQGYEFGSCCSMSTLYFLLPPPVDFFIQLNDFGLVQINKSKLFHNLMRILFDAILAGFMMFCSVFFESIVYLQNYYSLGGSVCVFIFSWMVLCSAFYSLCFRAPAEPAVYEPYDQYNLQHYYRAFYVVSFQLIEIIYK